MVGDGSIAGGKKIGARSKGSISRLEAFATCHKREASFLPVQDDNHAVSHQGPEIVPADGDPTG